MAQINITLNQDEILQLLSENRDDAFKNLLQESLNAILKAESQEQLHAAPYERSENRTDSRNGFRERELTTRIGQITLSVPRHRYEPFKTMIFENYSRSEASLIAGMTEMVVNGVSTRKVTRVVEAICGKSISKSSVSDLCKDLDKNVNDFLNRSLDSFYPFITFDATYFKVRENHRVISKAFMVAYATNKNGYREIIGFAPFRNESKETWVEFLQGLKKRGLAEMLMITSDAHEGMLQAITQEFPHVPWQRCQFHFSRNILDKVPKKYQAGLATELGEMFRSEKIEEAREKCREIIRDYEDIAEKAMECLDKGFENSMTVMNLPRGIRRFYRTSNPIERINREMKRRSNVIGVFPNEASLVRMMGSLLIEENERTLNSKRVYGEKCREELMKPNLKVKLATIAKEQADFLAVA